MEWFYRLNGQATGPISANDLKALFEAKTISAETQVRRNDMSAWHPLRHFVKGAPSPPTQNPGAGSSAASREIENREGAASPETPPAAQPSSSCSECGRALANEDLIWFDDARICANCKPRFIQELRESARSQDGLAYAGFWIRFRAKFIDVLVLVVINMVLGLGFLLAVGALDAPGGSAERKLYRQTIFLCIGAAYTTFFLGRYGATPGKMANGLRVVSPSGGAIGYRRALGRHLAEYLSGLLLLLGYLMAAFDSEKRALHDRICSTRVVRH